MKLQYLSDDDGHITAVQLPIQEWERLKAFYPNIDNIDSPLPDWQQEIIDRRLNIIQQNPESLKPINGLTDLLDKEA